MFKSIVVPIDLAQPSSWQSAIPHAIDQANASGGALTVMTVVREMSAMFEAKYLTFMLEEAVSEARRALADIVARYSTRNLAIRTEVRFGRISAEILACAQETGADLILMASHRPEMRDYLIGPNAAHVARHAPCSVLVLRQFDPDTGRGR